MEQTNTNSQTSPTLITSAITARSKKISYLLIATLILIYPIGLVLMWVMGKYWPLGIKIVVSMPILFLFVMIAIYLANPLIK